MLAIESFSEEALRKSFCSLREIGVNLRYFVWSICCRSRTLAARVALVLACLLCAALPAISHAEDDYSDTKIVRVGYYEDAAFQAGAVSGAVRSGYSYEYLQRLKRYTNWEYEYVYGDFVELYNKLRSGEIDLLTGLAYKSDRVDTIGYPTLPMGHTPYFLLKRSSDKSLSEDPQSLNGKKIGVLDGNMKSMLQEYLEGRKIQAQIVIFNDPPDRNTALRIGSVDLILIEDLSSEADEGLEVYLQLGSSDFYVCVAKNRPDILNDLEKAQDRLFSVNPKLLSDLSTRYYRRTALSSLLKSNESEWVASHKKLTIGYHTNYLPYSGNDEMGNVTGLVKDIVAEIFRLLGIRNVEVVYRGYDDFAGLLKALHDREVDIAFPAHVNFWVAENEKFIPSEPVVTTYLDLIYFGEPPNLEHAVFAIPAADLILSSYKKLWFPDNKAVYYSSNDESLRAVLSHAADAAFINGLRTDYILRSKFRYRNLSANQVRGDIPLGFAALSSNNDLLQIINHGLKLVEPEFALHHSLPYQKNHRATFADILFDNLPVTVLVIILVGFLSIALIARIALKRKENALLAAMARVDKMTELGNRRAFDEYMDSLKGQEMPSDFVFVQMDLNGLKRMNDEHGHVAGDEMIEMAARCMRSVLSPYGNVYRIGGDEFAALIRVPGEQVEPLVRELETAFEQAKGEHCPEVTVSVGWVRAEDRPDLSLEEMGQEADRRMYEDKKLYYRKRGMPSSCIR